MQLTNLAILVGTLTILIAASLNNTVQATTIDESKIQCAEVAVLMGDIISDREAGMTRKEEEHQWIKPGMAYSPKMIKRLINDAYNAPVSELDNMPDEFNSRCIAAIK